MLNYDLLYNDFKEILNSFDEQSLENWLIFDNARLNNSLIVQSPVNIDVNTYILKDNIFNPISYPYFYNAGNNSYLSSILFSESKINKCSYSDIYSGDEQSYDLAA